MNINCKICNKEIKFYPSRPRKVCSRKCFNILMKTNNPMSGKYHTEETKEKIRQKRLGKKHTKEAKKKISEATSGINNPMYGKHHIEKTKEKIGKANKGKSHLHTKETKDYLRKINLGEKNPMYGKESWCRGKKNIHSEKGIKNIKKAARKKIIENLKKINKNFHPPFNLKACEYFKQFDEENNTQGKYATNGGEYHIKELGYFPDYINFDLKLIIEWDEKYHFKKGKLRDKDIIRQNEIQNYFPEFEFRRIREVI